MNMYKKSLSKDKEIQKLRDENVDMHQALEGITNVCEITPEGSSVEVLDEAINKIVDISKQYCRPERRKE